MAEWFEDEAFWRELYPLLFVEERFERADAEVEAVIGFAGVPAGAHVLDLCCGPGRHAVALAKRGFRVTAVDRTPFLLDRARERAAAAGVAVEFVLADMREFSRDSAFDLVLNMYTSFGYFADKGDDLRVLDSIRGSLRPGGALVLDVAGKEILARIYEETSSRTAADGTVLVERHEVFDDWTRIRNEWILLRGDDPPRRFRFHHTIYSGQEMRTLLERAGFEAIRQYGGFDGQPYGVEATRLISVARRPG